MMHLTVISHIVLFTSQAEAAKATAAAEAERVAAREAQRAAQAGRQESDQRARVFNEAVKAAVGKVKGELEAENAELRGALQQVGCGLCHNLQLIGRYCKHFWVRLKVFVGCDGGATGWLRPEQKQLPFGSNPTHVIVSNAAGARRVGGGAGAAGVPRGGPGCGQVGPCGAAGRSGHRDGAAGIAAGKGKEDHSVRYSCLSALGKRSSWRRFTLCCCLAFDF